MGAPHVEPPGGICDCCGKLIQEDDNDPYVCALCRAEIAKLVKDRGE
jgi:Zn finger protein HypA/HybF involved in hydrogenase expression